MSKKQKERSAGYKPVECQSLEKELHANDEAKPEGSKPSNPSNPYFIVGKARLSKSRQSLSIKIDGEPDRFFTILLSDIQDMVDDASNQTVALVREYQNANNPTELKAPSGKIVIYKN